MKDIFLRTELFKNTKSSFFNRFLNDVAAPLPPAPLDLELHMAKVRDVLKLLAQIPLNLIPGFKTELRRFSFEIQQSVNRDGAPVSGAGFGKVDNWCNGKTTDHP